MTEPPPLPFTDAWAKLTSGRPLSARQAISRLLAILQAPSRIRGDAGSRSLLEASWARGCIGDEADQQSGAYPARDNVLKTWPANAVVFFASAIIADKACEATHVETHAPEPNIGQTSAHMFVKHKMNVGAPVTRPLGLLTNAQTTR